MILNRLADCLAAGFAVDEDMPAALHREADDRNFQQFFFGDETRLTRHERGRREDVEEALMIGDEDVAISARRDFRGPRFPP